MKYEGKLYGSIDGGKDCFDTGWTSKDVDEFKKALKMSCDERDVLTAELTKLEADLAECEEAITAQAVTFRRALACIKENAELKKQDTSPKYRAALENERDQLRKQLTPKDERIAELEAKVGKSIYQSVADYEQCVGYKVGAAFKIGFIAGRIKQQVKLQGENGND